MSLTTIKNVKINHIRYWAPTKFFIQDLLKNGKDSTEDLNRPLIQNYALIILNQPISNSQRDKILDAVWSNASLRICADGGANRLYECVQGSEKEHRYIPEYICGDLDSLHTEVANYYMSKGAEIEGKSEDQDSTDFEKCIALIDHIEHKNRQKEQLLTPVLKYDVVALGALGGRLDQTISSIHILHKMKDERDIYLVSQDDVAILLDKGKHQIQCDPRFEGPTCGILPIGVSNAILTTNGLKWNLTKTPTSIGTMISTSNQLEKNIVTIETDSPVIWSIELKY
ncbi:hypothetical protein G9A89_004144 [Geosiphon pyriformis]|nr:hypothetical protein G9A89_004144 [Geosiphon pyriformis]